jgi:hypothetical protein
LAEKPSVDLTFTSDRNKAAGALSANETYTLRVERLSFEDALKLLDALKTIMINKEEE